MSGIEAVGLLLGILPLIVSVIEHYDDVLRPIHRYRQFTWKTQRFCDELETERAIFQAECQLLLGSVVTLKLAKEMLSDPHHPLWVDESVCEAFGHRLGTLGSICLSTISKVNDKLTEISSSFGQFSPETSQLPTSNAKEWFRTRKKKLKFAFSEGVLQTSISDLKALNETFRILSSQIIRFDSQFPRNEGQKCLTYSKMSALESFRMVRMASCRMYEALSRACTAHQEHLAKFCLETKFEESSNKIGHSQISFNLAYVPNSSVESHSQSKSTGAAEVAESNMVIDGNRPVAPEEAISSPTSEWTTASKWFEVESTMKPGVGSGSVQSFSQNGGASAAVTANDLCLQLHNKMNVLNRHSKSPMASLVTVLNSAELGTHQVYYPSIHKVSTMNEESIPLAELLRPKKGQPIGTIPQIYRLRIAKTLATAVLQFHGTPWLTDTWESEKILFNKASQGDWQSYAPSPHLLVRVATDSNLMESLNNIGIMASIVPNVTLFNLGVILLELAYGIPFRSLLLPDENDITRDATFTRFNAARRLASSVGAYFGAGYAELVRKCLRCDFGEGEDLGSPALQERMFEDVICRLEKLEHGLLTLQGG